MPPKRSKEEARARRQLEGTLGAKLPATLHCSFCGKSQGQVEKLIAGPSVFICDDCVGLCRTILDGSFVPPAAQFNPLDRPTEDLLSLLASVDFSADRAREFVQKIVDTLRTREVSWALIAEPLGVSRQAAWERFS